jgi:carboxylesterase
MTLETVIGLPAIATGGEAFYFPGGRVGCLLVHGFTGAPKEMHTLGEYLSAQGHSVLGVRLFAHATRPQDLLRARWEDWVADVENGFHILDAVCDQIVVMGLSMGGMLALIAGATLPVVGVVAMSTPYRLRQEWFARLRPLIPAASLLIPHIGKGRPDWLDAAAASNHLEYPDYPLRAIAELFDLLAEMRRCLPSLHVPVLLVNSRIDQTVTPEQSEAIADSLLAAPVERLMVELSGHVVTRDAAREQVFRAAATFAQRVTSA